MTTDFDSVIVGAGVIGLAIARQLARSGQNIMVLDRAARAGTQTSSRNSEVIHAGIYYLTGSLKARLCVEGRKLLYDFCASHGVETKRLGKLIVATTAEEEVSLRSIEALARANGVDDLEPLSQADVSKLEPEVRCKKALFSPSTGIVDAAGFMLALQGEAEALSTSFAFNTTFVDAEKQDENFIIMASGANGEKADITCKNLVNCAGHNAHDIARNILGYPVAKLPPRYLAKGSYCSLSGRSPFTHLIYPVPVSGALGIHATLDLKGTVRFGPDIKWIDELDYSMPFGLPEKFSSAVEPYWPEVRSRELTPSYCGIRPKIHGPQEGFADFGVQQYKEHGMRGLINLFGIESPGLTASLSIADFVSRDLER
jgi:L-2-hydroxyglutarate oxidase LhgO